MTTTIKGVHPFADLFPMLDDHDLKALADDIKENGLRQPLIVDADGLLIDGRNRLAACELATVTPDFMTLNGLDPVMFILSANVSRRHMTKGQIAIVAARAELANAPDGGTTNAPDGQPSFGWKKAAHLRVEKLVSRQVVDRAGTLVLYAPDLADQVLDNTKDFKPAVREAEARRDEVTSAESRLAILKEDTPELAAAVEDGSLEIKEAWRTRENRQREERDARDRTTNYFDQHIGYLTDMQGFDDEQITEAAGRYDPERSTRRLTKDDIDGAIAALRKLKKGWT